MRKKRATFEVARSSNTDGSNRTDTATWLKIEKVSRGFETSSVAMRPATVCKKIAKIDN
jgi:hypothetical protein